MGGAGSDGRSRGYQALRASEALHRATLESISDAVFLADDDGRFTFVCPNVDVIFGYVPAEVEAMGRLQALLGEDLFDPAELQERGEVRNVEREIATKSGARRVVLMHFKRVSIQGATVLCSCRDVTERKHAERELSATRFELTHAARLALVGEMTASIVHELTQPLTAILANASAGLRISAGPDATPLMVELHETFQDIHDVSRNAAEIVGRFRNLARKQPPELRALDLNGVAQEVVQLLSADAHRRGITLRADLAPSLPTVRGDRLSLQQVILNLLVNAMDAVVSPGARSEKQVTLTTHPATAGVACSVTDTGPGIPDDVLPLVFDHFFTTKKEGVGLGLAISRTLAEAHGGQITAEAGEGGGSTFRLLLPLSPTALTTPASVLESR